VFPNSWVEHIPFIFFLIDVIKPATIVELGTHTGNSYSAICQAVSMLHLNTKCYAVDTWEGDAHAGFYGNEIFDDLSKYHDPKYGQFSWLLRTTFDDAKAYFSDSSINLLHIDGLHTYDAVKHDFENWLEKVAENGIVVIHDTNVKEREFGVWKFWEEVRVRYPSFEFIHGNGLGILTKGDGFDPSIKKAIEGENLNSFRSYFSTIGAKYNYPIEKIGLMQLLREKNEFISTLTKEIDHSKSNEDHALLQSELEKSLLEKEKLTQEILITQKKVEMIQQSNSVAHALQKRRVEELERVLAEQDDLLEETKVQLEDARKELSSFLTSKSWKITRPFRKMVRFMKRGKK
jgi:hypothetical protein